ncbi:hypothetical protein ACNVED_11315 [Legionella sp. D16C41]|uniref:hypothetical protein n=1 Tax=Legionella sp. D16C41 TaxID=3402688 RepID=UPI003AF516C4
MSFHVKPLKDIKRIFLNETIHLLQYHNLISKDYNKKLEKPDEELLAAVRKLSSPRSSQVEFLWKVLEVLDSSPKIGFSDGEVVLDNHKRARCFTGVAFAVLDQIYKTYPVRDPRASTLYSGLERAVGLTPESETDEVNELDLASKLTLLSFANKFLSTHIYLDPSLNYVRETTPFSDIKKLDLHEVFNNINALHYATFLEVHANAQKNTLAKIEQRAQQAKEKEKATKVDQHSKGYFGRMFSATAPTTPNADNSKHDEKNATKHDEKSTTPSSMIPN